MLLEVIIYPDWGLQPEFFIRIGTCLQVRQTILSKSFEFCALCWKMISCPLQLKNVTLVVCVRGTLTTVWTLALA